jgi:hypothetical protein
MYGHLRYGWVLRDKGGGWELVNGEGQMENM